MGENRLHYAAVVLSLYSDDEVGARLMNNRREFFLDGGEFHTMDLGFLACNAFCVHVFVLPFLSHFLDRYYGQTAIGAREGG